MTVVALLIFWLVLIKVGIPRVVVVVTGSGLFGKPVFLSVSIDAATGQGTLISLKLFNLIRRQYILYC